MEVLRMIPGAKPELIESSCCGMAGSFGYEASHYDVSMQMAELSACYPPCRQPKTPSSWPTAPAAATRSTTGRSVKAVHVATLLASLL
jgi:hypothetical protein